MQMSATRLPFALGVAAKASGGSEDVKWLPIAVGRALATMMLVTPG